MKTLQDIQAFATKQIEALQAIEKPTRQQQHKLEQYEGYLEDFPYYEYEEDGMTVFVERLRENYVADGKALSQYPHLAVTFQAALLVDQEIAAYAEISLPLLEHQTATLRIFPHKPTLLGGIDS